MPSRQIWQAGHKRWGIENELFNTLATHWALDRCFRHDPAAIESFLLTLFIAFVLVQAFYRRNLKAPLRACFTLIGIVSEICLGLAAPTACRAPWLNEPSRPPP